MKSTQIIKNQIERSGSTVYLKDGEWTSTPFRACVSCLWRKKSSAFEDNYTQIGANGSQYYLYIGPVGHDITALSDEAVLELDGVKYEFKRKDAVRFCDEIVYYTGILRRIKEAEYEEYQELSE